MTRIRDVVFDCRHPASLARFWAAVLDGYQVAPYDEAELERLRGEGIDDPADDPTVLVESGPGVAPQLWFQRVPEPRTVKNRVHLDLATTELEAETERLLGLGARRLEPPSPEDGIVVLQDPEGNEFCVIQE